MDDFLIFNRPVVIPGLPKPLNNPNVHWQFYYYGKVKQQRPEIICHEKQVDWIVDNNFIFTYQQMKDCVEGHDYTIRNEEKRKSAREKAVIPPVVQDLMSNIGYINDHPCWNPAAYRRVFEYLLTEAQQLNLMTYIGWPDRAGPPSFETSLLPRLVTGGKTLKFSKDYHVRLKNCKRMFQEELVKAGAGGEDYVKHRLRWAYAALRVLDPNDVMCVMDHNVDTKEHGLNVAHYRYQWEAEVDEALLKARQFFTPID